MDCECAAQRFSSIIRVSVAGSGSIASNNELMNEALQLLQKLQQEHFYGSFEVKFENGQVTVMRKTETILPHQSRKSGASQNVHSTDNP